MDAEPYGPYVSDPSLQDVVGNGTLADVRARIRLCDKEWRGQGGQSLLFWAAKRGGESAETVEICRFLLETVGLEVDLRSAEERPFFGRTPLFLAARFAPPQVTAYLLERQANPNREDGAKQTPLFFAASGKLDGLESLLQRRADPNHQDQNGQTPLFYAAKARHSNLAAALLRHVEARGGATASAVNVKDKLLRQTPLFYAAQAGAAETCALLIDKRCNVDSIDANSQSALFWAAKDGRPDIVDLLLARLATADLRDASNETPLFYAVGNKQVEACRILVEKGHANPLTKSIKGRSPVDIAMECHLQDLVALFGAHADISQVGKSLRKTPSTASTPPRKRRRARGAEQHQEDDASSVGGSSSVAVVSTAPTATGTSASLVLEEGLLGELPRALLRGSAAEVRRLLAAGHDPEAAMARCGTSLLSLAAMRPDGDDIAAESICRVLVEECALLPSCGPTEATRATPLFHSVRQGLVRCSSYLLAARCEVHHKDENGRTALFIAASLETPECLALLLDSREDPNVKDLHGRTPVFEAAAHGHISTLEVLLQRGAFADIADCDGKHTLDIAAPSSVAALVNAKCDPNAPQSSSVACLFVAARQGNLAKVQALLEARADAMLQEEHSRRTPLHEAVDSKQLKVCRKLMEYEADASAQSAIGLTPLGRAKELNWQAVVKEMDQVSRQRRQRFQSLQAQRSAEKKHRLLECEALAKHGKPIEQVKAQVKELLKITDTGDELEETGSVLLSAAAQHQGRSNGLEVVKYLVEQEKIDPCSKTKQGRTALFSAAMCGNDEAVAYLIDQRCEVDACNAEGRTALFAAANQGHTAVVRTLLQKRTDVSRKDSFNQTALFFAACKSAECVSILLTARAEASIIDKNGQTALFYAARDGVDSAVRMLVHARADVNRMDLSGKPALFFAIKQGQAGTAAVLLDECDAWPPEDRSRGGCDLVEMAHAGGLAGIVRQLQTKAHLREALLRAAKEGTVEDVDRALAQGASMIATNAAGYYALHCAASRQDSGGFQCVRRLVEAHGANVNALDRQQQTPLFLAARDGSKESVLYLLSTKCDACHSDERGDTALFDAAQKGRPDVVALLLERGASASHRSATRQTAAFRAARAGSVKALVRLLDSGVHAGDTDVEGRTALFGVQNVECAQLLVDRKCSVDVRDCGMRTALFEVEGHAVLRLLLDARASVNARDQQQQTALFKASERGDIAAVRALLEAGADGSVIDNKGQTVLFGAVPGASLELVRLLVCEAWANPAIKDAKGTTVQQVVKRAKPAAGPGVADYLAKAARAQAVPAPTRGTTTLEPVVGSEKRRRYRFAFTDPADDTGTAQLQFGTPQYEEALAQLAKQCPWLRMSLWFDGSNQIPVQAEMGGGTSAPLQSPVRV